jgi:hypothetical protein
VLDFGQSLACSISNPLMRRIALVVSLLILASVALIGFWLVSAFNGVASLEPGMIELHLPSGATAYLRRQAYFDKPADVYVSASDDFCKPFDRWHDYKMSEPIHGAPDSPLLISYSGDTIVVHAPKKPQPPRSSGPASFNVAFQELPIEKYVAYAASGKNSIELPEGLETYRDSFRAQHLRPLTTHSGGTTQKKRATHLVTRAEQRVHISKSLI